MSVPTTYDEFKAVCQTLLDAGIQPLYEPFSDGWHHVLWFPELGPRYEEVTPGLADALNANEATFAGNETLLIVLQQYKELYDMGCMGQNALSDAYSERTSVMANGDAAMILANLTSPQEVEADFPEVPAESFGQYDTLVKFLRLRYRLRPYIYSLAGMVTHESYTMIRALPFDCRGDSETYNIDDQYMFRPIRIISQHFKLRHRARWYRSVQRFVCHGIRSALRW